MRYANLIFLFCISSNALSANWIEAGDAIYVDINSIKKDKGLVSYSSLENMTTMGLNSVVVTNEANCAERKVTELNILYYGQPMGQGELVERNFKQCNLLNQILKIPAMKFACQKAK